MFAVQETAVKDESVVEEFDIETAALEVVHNHTTVSPTEVPDDLTIAVIGIVPGPVIFNE